jgi:hypothetical protein
MKKNLPFHSLLMAVPISLLVLVSFTGGQTGEFSGSPGDGGTTCTQCHATGANHGGIPALTNVPTFYNAGQVYDLNLAINGSSVSKFGFNITAETAGGIKQGTWTAISGSGTRIRADSHGLTHTTGGSSSNNWTVRWTAPASDDGPVTFYYATLQANNAGGNRGDQMVSGQSTAVLTNVDLDLSAFKLFPTQVFNEINIELAAASDAQLMIYNMNGQLVKDVKVSNSQQLNVSDLTSGTYITQVAVNGQVSTQKFIKK